MVEKQCEVCGEKYSVRHNRKDKARFCSLKCFGFARRGEENPAWKGMPVTIGCEVCKKLFNVSPNRRDKARFCSARCMGVAYKRNGHPCWKGGKVELKCRECHKSFSVALCRVKKAKYCSLECANEAQRGRKIKISCAVCNKSFSVYPCLAKKKKFCSKKCMGVHQKNIVGESNPAWKGGKTKTKCHTCGKLFEVRLSPSVLRKKRGKFCSYSCNAINIIKHHIKGKHTGIELKVAEMLDNLGIKYVDQHPIPEGRTVVDFYVPEQRLVIYADGDYWHSTPKVKNKDQAQDFILGMNGYKVLRLPETEINKNKQKCINKIKKTMEV